MAGRTRGRRRRRGMPPELLRGILVVLAIGACVYVALATAVGNFVAEKIVAPVFRQLSGKTAVQSSPSPTEEAVETVQPQAEPAEEASETLALVPQGTLSAAEPAEGGGAQQQTELRVEGQTYYALQLGVFSEKANAETLSRQMQARAAGGYIYEDGERFRVFAAVYDSREAARTVKKQLMEQNGIDSSLYELSAAPAALRITAPEAQSSAVQEGFSQMESVCSELLSLCEAFDRKEVTAAQAKEQLRSLAEACRRPAEALSSVRQGIAAGLCAELTEKAQRITDCAQSDAADSAAFSAALKYLHIGEVCACCRFLSGIGTA